MLRLRLADGLPLARLGRGRAWPRRSGRWRTACSTPRRYAAGRAVLTLRGRLLADAVVRDLLPDRDARSRCTRPASDRASGYLIMRMVIG